MEKDTVFSEMYILSFRNKQDEVLAIWDVNGKKYRNTCANYAYDVSKGMPVKIPKNARLVRRDEKNATH